LQEGSGTWRTCGFAEKLLEREFPWSRLRQVRKLLRLTERYDPERVNHACARALRFELLDVRGVERILQQALEHDPTPDTVRGQTQELLFKFLRPSDHFTHSQSKGGTSC